MVTQKTNRVVEKSQPTYFITRQGYGHIHGPYKSKESVRKAAKHRAEKTGGNWLIMRVVARLVHRVQSVKS